MDFDERFQGSDLDPAVWIASYLPAWSSREASAATYDVAGGRLRLSIPVDQQLWCADLHDPPLRVSAVQSGNWSGPVGSGSGQSPFRDGLVVREAQSTLLGFIPHHGRVEVTCRATIAPASMFSAWLIGMEDQPERCGEICIVEVFGDAIRDGIVQVGCGVHAFRDPALVEDFDTVPMRLDVSEDHRYAVDWSSSGVDFLVDGEVVRRSAQSPTYPLQLILGVFDFPEADDLDATFVPELVVSRVLGEPVVRR